MYALSVIIVNYNSGELLKRCLNSLRCFLTGVSHEICVVDNTSSDGSVPLAQREFPHVRWIVNPSNLGFAAALNLGLRATSGRYILWLNPDAELLNSGMAELIRYLDQNPSVGILGPLLVNPDGSRQLSCRSFPSYRTALFHRYALLTRLFPGNPYSRQYLHSGRYSETIHDVDWVSGACLLHRREVAERLGGLDERFFMYCEDVDFCLRARRAGWTTQHHPGARVLHYIGVSSRHAAVRMIAERHRSLWRYYRKHFHPNPLKDLAVGPAIAARCGLQLAQNAIIERWPSMLR